MKDTEAYFPANNPVDILQDLICFDTTNSPGNEGPCMEYIRRLLKNSGTPTQILAKNADERVPGDAVEFGANAVHDLLCRYGRANSP
ncbi:MAG: hypothetical protein ACLFUY_01680 [Desulfobacterales bacterium]